MSIPRTRGSSESSSSTDSKWSRQAKSETSSAPKLLEIVPRPNDSRIQMGRHKIERPTSPPSKPDMTLKREPKSQKKYSKDIKVNLDDPDPVPTHQNESGALRKNKSIFTNIISKRARSTSEKTRINKADRKKLNAAKQLATALFCISLSDLEMANLETKCSEYLNNIQRGTPSNGITELTWDFYAATSIKRRYCPSADATVPQELVDYLEDMRDACMNEPAPSFHGKMVAEAIGTLAEWWRSDCEGHKLKPDWVEPISMSVISDKELRALQASCFEEVKRLQGDVPQNFFSDGTKAAKRFKNLFSSELLLLSKSFIGIVDAHLKTIDIRALELKMSLKDNSQWEDFMSKLLPDISNWIKITIIPLQVEKSLTDIFRMINAAELAGNNETEEINEIKSHAKQRVIYQLFMRPMIGAVTQRLEEFRAPSFSTKVRLAIEISTDQNFPPSQRKQIESTQAIAFANGTSSGQHALLEKVLKLEQQGI